MNWLTQQLVIEARKYVGVAETSRNSGPHIDDWLRRVQRSPGAPWCAAFAWCMLDDACHAIGVRNPIHPVAGVHLFRQLGKEQDAWTREPGPGYVYFIDHGVDPRTNAKLGHCGICVEVSDKSLIGIEGNTNEAGGREGNCVAIKHRRLGEISLGYLDPGALIVEQELHRKDGP